MMFFIVQVSDEQLNKLEALTYSQNRHAFSDSMLEYRLCCCIKNLDGIGCMLVYTQRKKASSK